MMGEFVTAAQSGAHEAQGWPNTAYGTTKVLFSSLFLDSVDYLRSCLNSKNKIKKSKLAQKVKCEQNK